MKNLIKHTKKGFLMVTMFATLLSFANENSFFTIKNDAKKTVLILKNVKEGNLLSIIDNNGIILYKELIEQNGVYSKGFDLTSLPDGKYIFELDKDIQIDTIPFTVTSNNVVFSKAEEKTIFKPYTRVKGNMLYITKLALNEEPLKIDIYFSNAIDSKLMYSEKIEGTKNIQKVYRLSGLEQGNYKVVMKTEGKTFTKNI
ncbi:hypothetical protein SAMN05428642_101648 [Flaviramulus basaltis]|uniref:Por secretion system C-terminal sorting domain-containing protein n=1 Tax=Flaviramulus basaltis TaxID=369401 RepID=A0A1K2ICE3_9FLAO|nr:hypothetical protein [Flaviramulus basaltis]SFZ89938.1 hypothetical protein SAMN05428642_101648 [Flaviramulus basaltis]